MINNQICSDRHFKGVIRLNTLYILEVAFLRVKPMPDTSECDRKLPLASAKFYYVLNTD